MRVQQQCTRGLIWDDHQPPSLSLGCKRLRPLAPPVSPGDRDGTTLAATFDVKSFIKPECGPRKIVSSCDAKKARSTHQVEAQAGGTRWNPTQEQIGILEMLYKSGMRTPNAHEIEQITTQLGKYGKIEGKNVFYWFQNHKARERQKLKRTLLGLSPLSPRTPSPRSIDTSITLTFETTVEQSPYKKKCQKWRFEDLEENREEGDKTLELFPLHPEAR